MTREKAEQMLDALQDEERQALKDRMERARSQQLPAPGGKDW